VLLRRLASIPLLFVAAILYVVLFPFLVLIAWGFSRLSGARGAIPTLLFVGGYLLYEIGGLARLFWVWLTGRQAADYMDRNRTVQYWWANALRNWVSRCFRLRFSLSGSDALHGRPAMVFPRHASLADTVLPIVFYGIPERIKMRYVLKRELLWDPCLDVGGNRIPNHFVDRSGEDSQQAVAAVDALTATLGDNEGIAMFPEGTRFTPAKHARLGQSKNEELRGLAARWPDLLPPRLGGTLAILGANPGNDLLYMAHTGFEPASRLKDLLSGAWLDSEVRIHFWRVPFSEIPAPERQKAFLFEQWDRMQSCVERLRRGERCD